jgi:hypothetical protein
MARELDSEMLGRLQASYGAMSDGELLELAAKPDELTDSANEVLRGEMSRRGLQAAASEQRVTGGVLAGWESAEADEGEAVPAGWSPLMTFNDAIMAGEACKHLEAAGIGIEIRDRSQVSTTGGSFYGGAPVALQIVVPSSVLDIARETLRTKMKLFPMQEVEGDDAPDDAALLIVASFGQREDADAVGRVLADAGVWRQVSVNPDGAAETEDAFTVEVREADQEKALELVEKAMGIAEE